MPTVLGHSSHTTFVGRRELLAESRSLLLDTRLLTVTGPGGVGKTRFARELAARVRSDFPHGVGLVDLTALADGSEVAAHSVSSLGVQDQSTRSPFEQLARHIGDGRMLIVFDNCEHLRESTSDLIADLLDVCPGLHLLSTSTEPLDVPGEHILALPPLGLPPALGDDASVDEAEAVTLLVERARQVLPTFSVTATNRADVAELCIRLDGVPLAIELAAARLRVLSPRQLLERLDERFSLLTGRNRQGPARHQTLRALVDWSFDRCTDEERRLWSRLSVFLGHFSLESAEQVCGFGELDPARVLDILDGLVTKSVLAASDVDGAVRYRQLITIREYGAELLAAEGETDVLRRRHRDHYLQRACAMADEWCAPHQSRDLLAMRRDHPNVAAALEWSVATRGEESAAARFASCLRYHWIAGGYLSEGRRWLDRTLALDAVVGGLRGETLWVTAWVSLIQGDRAAARRYLGEAREVAVTTGDAMLTAYVDAWTGLLNLFTGNLEESIASYRRALTGFQGTEDRAAAGTAMFQMAVAQTYAGDPGAALETCTSVLGVSRAYDEHWNRAYALWVTGLCSWHRGQYEEATAGAVAALQIQRSFQDGICIALALLLLSWIAVEQDRMQRAAALAGSARAVWRLLGTDVEAFGPHISGEAARLENRLRNAMGSARVDAEYALVAGSTKLEALERGLAVAHEPVTGPAVHGNPLLTVREQEVASCLADGLSNKAIADKLVISPRTVEGHVEHILTKLGFTSRTQIVAWVLRNQ